jgi:hypothetical protein
MEVNPIYIPTYHAGKKLFGSQIQSMQLNKKSSINES